MDAAGSFDDSFNFEEFTRMRLSHNDVLQSFATAIDRAPKVKISDDTKGKVDKHKAQQINDLLETFTTFIESAPKLEIVDEPKVQCDAVNNNKDQEAYSRMS